MTVVEEQAGKVIGTPMLRREDPALLTGEAKFTNDLHIPGALHLAVLRSPYAHARITSVDVSGAASQPRAQQQDPPRETRMAVVGDFGSGDGAERAVAGAVRASAERRRLDAFVTTGDNVYERGEPELFAAQLDQVKP